MHESEVVVERDVVGYRGVAVTSDAGNPTLRTAIMESKRDAVSAARKLGRAAGYRISREDVAAVAVFFDGERDDD